MREQFAHWYPLPDDDRERLVRDGLVTVDTNVLLDLYRMNRDAREEVLSLFRRLGDRLWIPHQVGLEFHRNRLQVVHDQEQIAEKLRNAVSDASAKLEEAARSLRDHPVIKRAELLHAIEVGFEVIYAYLDKLATEPTLSLRAATREDPVLDAVTLLFRGRVGSPYSSEEESKVLAEAKRRIEKRIPPGYADAKKDGDRAAGDFIVWRQILDEAGQRKLPVLFVTNDQKEDWYHRLHGVTVGPRIELVSEMHSQAGVVFHAQTLVRFLDLASPLLAATVNENTVAEVNRLDEIGRAIASGDLAARAVENALRDSTAHSADQCLARTQKEEPALEVLQMEARRSELVRRIAQLRAELDEAQSSQGPEARPDPRSYARAVEARLQASSELLAELDSQLLRLYGPSSGVNIR